MQTEITKKKKRVLPSTAAALAVLTARGKHRGYGKQENPNVVKKICRCAPKNELTLITSAIFFKSCDNPVPENGVVNPGLKITGVPTAIAGTI